jgi:hypothetical protein
MATNTLQNIPTDFINSLHLIKVNVQQYQIYPQFVSYMTYEVQEGSLLNEKSRLNKMAHIPLEMGHSCQIEPISCRKNYLGQ